MNVFCASADTAVGNTVAEVPSHSCEPLETANNITSPPTTPSAGSLNVGNNATKFLSTPTIEVKDTSLFTPRSGRSRPSLAESLKKHCSEHTSSLPDLFNKSKKRLRDSGPKTNPPEKL